MEITIADLFLLIWAIVATIGWHKHKEDSKAARAFIHIFLNDKGAREEILAQHDAYMAKKEAMRLDNVK
jgi:hypothetical protein